MITERDKRRLRDGAIALALKVPVSREELIVYRDKLGRAIAAMQSLDDLGTRELNEKAWNDMLRIEKLYNEANEKLK
jgi:hypothetical protein